MNSFSKWSVYLVSALSAAACATPEPLPAPPPPAVAVLECAQAVWNGSPYGAGPLGMTVFSGPPQAVGVYGTPGTAPWGLVCMNGFTRTGCHISPDTRFGAAPAYYPYPTYSSAQATPAPDWDDWDLRSDGTPDGNGCYTTRPELISRAAISISCCRVAERR